MKFWLRTRPECKQKQAYRYNGAKVMSVPEWGRQTGHCADTGPNTRCWSWRRKGSTSLFLPKRVFGCALAGDERDSVANTTERWSHVPRPPRRPWDGAWNSGQRIGSVRCGWEMSSSLKTAWVRSALRMVDPYTCLALPISPFPLRPAAGTRTQAPGKFSAEKGHSRAVLGGI